MVEQINLSAATAADYQVDNTIAGIGGSYSQLLDTLVSGWSATLRDISPGIERLQQIYTYSSSILNI
jgi:hypothetical protein